MSARYVPTWTRPFVSLQSIMRLTAPRLVCCERWSYPSA